MRVIQFEKAGANKLVYENDEIAIHQVFRTGLFHGFWLPWGMGVYANSFEGAKLKLWALMQHYMIERNKPKRYHRSKPIEEDNNAPSI